MELLFYLSGRMSIYTDIDDIHTRLAIGRMYDHITSTNCVRSIIDVPMMNDWINYEGSIYIIIDARWATKKRRQLWCHKIWNVGGSLATDSFVRMTFKRQGIVKLS